MVRRPSREEIGEDHLQAARAATAIQQQLEAEASEKGLSVEDYMRALNVYPLIDPLDNKLDTMQYQYLRAAKRATALQREIEEKAYLCGMTVEQYMQAKKIFPCDS